MVLFADLARLAAELAREPSKLKKRAAIAEAVLRAVKSEGSGFEGPGLQQDGTAGDRFEGAGLPPRPHLDPQESGFRPGGNARQAGRFCLYLAGQPFAEADSRKLNAGGAILSRAVKELSGAADAALSAAYRRHGDLGAAAHDLLAPPCGKAPAEATLALDDIAAAFDTMATARSTAARFAAVEGLLRRATALEAKYLLKLMLGDMRIGVAQPLVEEAIAVASGSELTAVRHAVMLEADLARAVERAFAGTLAEARMTLFHPLGFMLASPVETPEEAVDRFTPKPPKPVKPKPAKKPRKRKDEPTEQPDDAEAFPDLPADEASASTEDLSSRPEVEGRNGETPVFAGARAEGTSPNPEGAGAFRPLNGASEVEGALASSLPDPSSLIPDPSLLALVEDKFDGMRVQLHCGDPAQPGRVALYSRNREDVTHSFPEIEEAFRNVTTTGPLILDGEVLGWDYATGKALPFAVLGQRIGRKKVDNDLRRQIPVVYVAFDLLFHAGDLVLPLPLRERRTRLEAIATHISPATLAPFSKPEAPSHQQALFDQQESGCPRSGFSDLGSQDIQDATTPRQRLKLSEVHLVEGAAAIDQAYRDARARANEGVMLKAAGSPYLAGRRGIYWLKLKRELATLDVVITGAEFGSGRRAQFLSDYTFAVRGAVSSDGGPGGQPELLNVGKAYSGVTDAEIVELTEWLKAHTLEDFGHFRTVEPIRVLEVAFNNVMRSDRHRSGFALRFPRILRIRDDKPVEEIDTLERVEEIYNSQPDRPVGE